jgi:phage gpG-like protein
LEIAGEVAMDRGIARFADGLSDYRPLWPIIEDDYYAQEKDQFKSEGEEGGDKWSALTPEYAGWKEAHFPGKPILQRTGDLYDSLTNPNSPNGVRIEERKSLTLGSRLPYAIFHQQGTAMMDARPEIQFTEALKRSIMHHAQVYLVTMASQCGFRNGGWSPIDVSRAAASRARRTSPGSHRSTAGPRARDSKGRFTKKK